MTPPLRALDAAPATATTERETIIPLLEEQLSVDKRVVETVRVRVSRVTHKHEQIVDELLHHEKVEVERVPVAQVAEVAAASHQRPSLRPAITPSRQLPPARRA